MKTEENVTATAIVSDADTEADSEAAATADDARDARECADDDTFREKKLGYKVMPPEYWRTPPPKYDGTGPVVYTWTYTHGFVRTWPR